MVLEKTPESPLDCKEIQPVHSEGDQPWDFFGGNNAESETSVLCPSHAKSLLLLLDMLWVWTNAQLTFINHYLPAKARDAGLIPGSRRSPGEGNGNSLQYSCLENPMDNGGAWQATVHGVAKSGT